MRSMFAAGLRLAFRPIFRKTLGIHVAVLMVMGGAVAAAFGFRSAGGIGAIAERVNTPCDGIDVDAVRFYKPTSRTDAHVEFPIGSLTFAVPDSIPVITGASGNGKTRFTFSLNGGTPIACVYRGNGTNAYDFVGCRETASFVDPDDDVVDQDDAPIDPLLKAGTEVTADSFTVHVNRGDHRAGTTTVHLHLEGPLIDDGDQCTIDSCDAGAGVSHVPVTEFVPPPQATIVNGQTFPNPNGSHSTYSTRDGAFLDTTNPFFQQLGTNERACVSCHQVEDGFGLSAAHVRARFENSCGLDPIFRPVDGANNPTADVSTVEARRNAYGLLLDKGLIRIQLNVPANAQFEVIAVDDPYGNSSTKSFPLTQISVFRRPLPSTNLKFLGAISVGAPASTVATPAIMWDGRETANPFAGLMNQANNATLTHAESGASLTAAVLTAIVDFELALFTAQETENAAGSVSIGGANGGALFLSTVPFTVAENRAPNPIRVDVFHAFDSWAGQIEQRDAVARGQALFNTRVGINPLSATCASHVPNDCSPGAQVGAQAMTCSRCHSAFETGGNDGGAFGNSIANAIGNFTSGGLAGEFRTADLPLYTLRQKAAPNAIIKTTDPGRAMITVCGLT